MENIDKLLEELEQKKRKLIEKKNEIKYWDESIDLFLKYLYETNDNPIYAWESLRLSLEDDREISAWVKDYLRRVSNNISSLIINWETNIRNRDAIKKVLEIKSQNKFTWINKLNDKMLAWIQVKEFLDNDDSKLRGDSGLYSAFLSVAENFHVSEETIKNWYYEIDEIMAAHSQRQYRLRRKTSS